MIYTLSSHSLILSVSLISLILEMKERISPRLLSGCGRKVRTKAIAWEDPAHFPLLSEDNLDFKGQEGDAPVREG